MDENQAFDYIPKLTLDPNAAAAVQEAPAAPAWQPAVEQSKPEAEPEKLDIERLSPQEQEEAEKSRQQPVGSDQ